MTDRHTTMTSSKNRLRSLILVALLATGLGVAGCSAGGNDVEPASTDAGAPEAAEGADVPEQQRNGMAFDAAGEAMADLSARPAAGSEVEETAAEPADFREPAIISVGTITLQSEDVAAARFDVDKVVDSYGGSVADEKTTASTDGEVRLSRVVLRIPSKDFDAAMTDLAELGKVTASTRKAEDVTAQVIDTEARIRAQEQSLERVEVLFTRAQNIRDIVAIEAQLSRRQAELDSLKGQLAYLNDQASLSTITVYLELAPEPEEKPAAQPEQDDNAFVGGLKDGWNALSELASGLATVAGALLPFVAVGVLLGVPAAIVARRWLARHPVRRPETEAAEPA